MEVLIGTVAAGMPALIYFFWWSFRADNSVLLDGSRFSLSAISTLVLGGVAGALCRVFWPKAGSASAYRVANTVVWACAGSFVAYFGVTWITGNTPAVLFLAPVCQGISLLFAMAYARCGELGQG